VREKRPGGINRFFNKREQIVEKKTNREQRASGRGESRQGEFGKQETVQSFKAGGGEWEIEIEAMGGGRGLGPCWEHKNAQMERKKGTNQVKTQRFGGVFEFGAFKKLRNRKKTWQTPKYPGQGRREKQ